MRTGRSRRLPTQAVRGGQVHRRPDFRLREASHAGQANPRVAHHHHLVHRTVRQVGHRVVLRAGRGHLTPEGPIHFHLLLQVLHFGRLATVGGWAARLAGPGPARGAS